MVQDTVAEPEVACPVTFSIPACAFLPRGLLSLMGTTCVGLGGSRVWRGRSFAPLGLFTFHPQNQKWGTGLVNPAELEVTCLVPSWILAGAIMAWGLMRLMWTACIGLGVSCVWWHSVICPLGQVT